VETRPEPLPDAPLVRLEPATAEPPATISEVAEGLELRLELIAARVGFAIAEAWDSGRLSGHVIDDRPPFEAEVFGLLGFGPRFAPNEVEHARTRVVVLERRLAEAEHARGRRPMPLELLAADFELTPLAQQIVLVIAAPRLRGALARLYRILANSDKRALVDEQLLGQILGEGLLRQIARELDADQPLRRYGLVHLDGDRPSAALAVDPLVVRFIANRPYGLVWSQ